MFKSIKNNKAKLNNRFTSARKDSKAIKGTVTLTRRNGGSYAKYSIEDALTMFQMSINKRNKNNKQLINNDREVYK